MFKLISDPKALILQYSISYTHLSIHKWGILKEIALFLSCLTRRTVIECGEILNAGETKENWEQTPEAWFFWTDNGWIGKRYTNYPLSMDMKYEYRIRNKNQSDLPKSHCIGLTKCEIVAGPKSKRRGNRGRKKLLPVPPKLESFSNDVLLSLFYGIKSS